MKEKYIQAIRTGLPAAVVPKNVTIIGAGLAGLTAGSLLKAAGHKVTILEGTGRIGGRVYTLRKPFTPGNYLEAGAMRIPSDHVYVMEYIKKFKLPLEKFINLTPEDILYVNGIITRREIYSKNPDILNFPVLPSEKGKTAEQLVKWSTQPFFDVLKNGTTEEKQSLLAILSKQSFADYFRKNIFDRNLSPAAVDMISTIMSMEGIPTISMVEVLFDFFKNINSPGLKLYAIPGGNDLLTEAFLPMLKNEIFLNEIVSKIKPHEKGVTVFSTNHVRKTNRAWQSDYLIITVPFTSLQYIQVEPVTAFSFKKRRAIISLNYATATKIGIEFKTRFWENNGNYGGQTVTDGPTGNSYYPSDRRNNVVLASYTWGQNTLIWDAMSEEQRIERVMKFLAKIHGNQVYNQFVAGGSFSWSQMPIVGGDFCIFLPYQRFEFGSAIKQPEGKVHFAGEHTSPHHGWMEGAIESGIRAAFEINENVKKSPS